MTSSPILAVLKVQHEMVGISVKNRLMFKIAQFLCMFLRAVFDANIIPLYLSHYYLSSTVLLSFH